MRIALKCTSMIICSTV